MNDYYDDQESFYADNEQKGEGMEILKKKVVVHERGSHKKLRETVFDADLRHTDLGLEGTVNTYESRGNALYGLNFILGTENNGKNFQVESLRLQLSERSLTELLMILSKMQEYAHSNLPQVDVNGEELLAQDSSGDVRVCDFSGARFHVFPETLDAAVHPDHIDRKARQNLAQMVLEDESKLTDDEKKMSTAKMAEEVHGVAAHAYSYIEGNYPKNHPLVGSMNADEIAKMVERLYALAEHYGADTSDDPGSPYYNSKMTAIRTQERS